MDVSRYEWELLTDFAKFYTIRKTITKISEFLQLSANLWTATEVDREKLEYWNQGGHWPNFLEIA